MYIIINETHSLVECFALVTDVHVLACVKTVKNKCNTVVRSLNSITKAHLDLRGNIYLKLCISCRRVYNTEETFLILVVFVSFQELLHYAPLPRLNIILLSTS